MSIYHHHPDLPWNVSTRDERRFRTISTTALACALLVGLIMSYITVPKPPREEAEQVPPRLAKMIIERKKLPPPPPPPKQETVKKEDIKKPEEPVKPKPQPAPKAEMKIEPKPLAKPEPAPLPAETPPPKVDIEAARKKAASTGLLALSNDLAALRDKPVVPNASDEKLVHPSKDEPFVQRAMITSGTARPGGSAAAVPPALASRNLGGTKLSERATTRVTSPEAARPNAGETSAPKAAPAAKGGRSDAELQMAFDKNKGALYSLYKRAQRQDPNLQGRVVLKLTIEPSGKISACDVVSSELDSQELIQKIVARVLMFDFGSEDTGTAVKTFSIDFVPTS